MIDLNDLQKPLVGVLALGAAATAGFLAGYIVGRDPETARRLARSVAGGLTRAQVAAADAMESLGDLWAEARAEARREVEDERFAEESTIAAAATPPAEPAAAAGPPVMRKARRKAGKATARPARPRGKAARRVPAAAVARKAPAKTAA
jgi:hypothetical protein